MLPLATSLLAAATLLAPQATQEAPIDLLAPPSNSPLRVEMGIFLIDLIAVDGSDQSFRADVVVEVAWRDPRLETTAEQGARTFPSNTLWRPRLAVVNQRALDQSLAEELRVEPDGTVSYVQRFLGTFSSPMDLREFPLDSQRFYVHVVVGNVDDGNLQLVPSQSPGAVAGRSEQLTISDWSIGPAVLEPAPLELAPGDRIQGMALAVEGSRELRYYLVQVILPLMMIVTMAWTVFWIDPAVVPTRVGTVVTTMLTLIAYRFALANLVPRLPYLTRLDWFMLGSTTLILATLMAMAASAYLKSQQRDELVDRLDRRGRVLFAVAAILVWTVPWLL